MFKGHVKCAECPTVPPTTIETDTLEELGALLGMAVITWHCKSPHSSHPLLTWIGEADQPSWIKSTDLGEEHDLKVRCIFDGCPRKEKGYEVRVPIQLVSAFTICVHSSHEGHPLEVTYNGKTWKSPI